MACSWRGHRQTFWLQWLRAAIDHRNQHLATSQTGAHQCRDGSSAQGAGACSKAANRTEITIANNLNTRAVMPKVMVQPGETVADILIRYAKLEQRFINVTPDGDLCFFFPDYTTPPQYVYNYNWDDALAERNNVEDGARDVDGSQVNNYLECVSSKLYAMAIAETDNPMEGLETGFAKHYNSSSDYFLRRLTFSDNESDMMRHAPKCAPSGVTNRGSVPRKRSR